MNAMIINNLQVLANKTTDRWRKKAYLDAIVSIKALDTPITSGAQAAKLPGIGPSISKKIDDIIATGTIKGISTGALDKISIIRELATVTGIGQVHAEKLYNAGARSIQDLEKYKNLLTDWQKVGLKYHTELSKRVPREIIHHADCLVEKMLEDICEKLDIVCQYEVCGSYRRGAATCGDMDILLSTKHKTNLLELLVKRLESDGYILATLGHGEIKYLGIVQIRGTIFRLDIEMITDTKWPYALLYFTGSADFNKKQRIIALEKGFTLSEHGLKNLKTGEWVFGLHSEQDVFKFLGMKYLKPCDR